MPNHTHWIPEFDAANIVDIQFVSPLAASPAEVIRAKELGNGLFQIAELTINCHFSLGDVVRAEVQDPAHDAPTIGEVVCRTGAVGILLTIGQPTAAGSSQLAQPSEAIALAAASLGAAVRILLAGAVTILIPPDTLPSVRSPRFADALNNWVEDVVYEAFCVGDSPLRPVAETNNEIRFTLSTFPECGTGTPRAVDARREAIFRQQMTAARNQQAS